MSKTIELQIFFFKLVSSIKGLNRNVIDVEDHKSQSVQMIREQSNALFYSLAFITYTVL